MGREIKRVALEFDWPLHEVWEGFLTPDRFDEIPCRDCARWEPGFFGPGGMRSDGSSDYGRRLHDEWYGKPGSTFDPVAYGSTLLTPETPAVRAFAERNVSSAPEFYGRNEFAVRTEAERLVGMWNRMWLHHLNAEDVAALVEAGRLMDFTHTWARGQGWTKIEPQPLITPQQVNEWSLRGMGHDSLNCWIAIQARAAREGQETACAGCGGHGSYEAYEGQRAAREAWEPQEPPAGEGWQMWETVSEGSPVSPVFASAEELARWLGTPEGGHAAGPSGQPMPYESALAFVNAGWAPSFISNGGGLHDGAHFVGTETVLAEHEES